ncbi:MAG: hypothetical protein AAFQ63_12350 [Cyanobacteria bacterium J06621_11]
MNPKLIKGLAIRVLAKVSAGVPAIIVASCIIAAISPASALHAKHSDNKNSNHRSSDNLTKGNRSYHHFKENTEAKTNESELVIIPGTSVSLIQPSGFILSEQFSGFENPDTFSSIVIAELPLEAYAEVAETFSSTPEEVSTAFANRGIVLDVKDISSIVVEGSQVPFVRGIQTVGSTQVEKYFALIEGESTVLITFNIMDSAQFQEEAVIETIQSVEISPAPTTQQKVDELPFTFAVAEPFQVFDVLAGSSVILSPNGETDPAGETPLIVIANSVSAVSAAVSTTDLADFSAQLLQNTEGFENSIILNQEPTTFAGGDGYFTQATADDEEILQYLTILPDGFYIRMVVLGNAESLEALMPTIQTIQNSVTAKPSQQPMPQSHRQ